MQLELNHTFDESTFRHSLNGHVFVLHCHHYMSLTTKMAEDFADLGGPKVLREATEDSIRPVFDSYYKEHGVTSPADRLEIGRQYYAAMGMGVMEIAGDTASATVTLKHCHVDEGWVKKWGTHDKPVNHFTCGYLAALFAAASGKPARSFQVVENASMVMGAPASVLLVKPA
jgi:hypothetical protein